MGGGACDPERGLRWCVDRLARIGPRWSWRLKDHEDMETNRRWNIEYHQRDVHCVVSLERAYPRWEQPGWDYTRPDSYSWWYFCYQAQGLGSGTGRGHLCYRSASSVGVFDMDSHPRYSGCCLCGVV